MPIFVFVSSFIISYISSYSITTEILRYCMNHQSISNDKKIVNFKNEISIFVIPSIAELSSDNIKELWYTREEYKKFKVESIY